ncbi:G patch domain-containing protein 4 [Varanus komodoensis]|uniref:G patch domain-containing protein 4 n=1 Tax=Varanus komodoensis TaxID=61221 RepID=A0A8D2J2Z6_VARKO|nr:G patch domain-containing protein 4 [Varanus komodoensis]KAF7238390.1 G patch domain-containing protein 4 [Varanus komodoensis]
MSNTSFKKKSKGLKFAEKQLKKHGWKKGKGLGKQENGISEAIKVKVKCDTAGVGHNSAEQFSYHWWDHLFNSAAANLSIEAEQGGVRVKEVSAQAAPVTNKKPRKAQGQKNMLYGRFVKAATLTSGGEESLNPVHPSDSSDEDDRLDLSTARRLTDEELVQACGGRTAHKGARHGLTMAAKLARLEEQEKAYLASRFQQQQQAAPTQAALNGGRRTSPRRKRESAKQSKRRGGGATPQNSLELMGEDSPCEGQEEEAPRKKKRKKRRKEKPQEDGGSEPEERQVEATGPEDRGTPTTRPRQRKAKRKAE